jgi:hypothetical protein
VRTVLENVAAEATGDGELGNPFTTHPQVLGVELLGEYEVVWRIIAETRPGLQYEVGRIQRERS